MQLIAFTLGGVFVLMQVSKPVKPRLAVQPGDARPAPTRHRLTLSSSHPQYFSSRSLITINWKSLTSSYDSFVVRNATPAGQDATVNRSGTLGRIVARFVDFVSADVQSRATFVLGMGLGFRLG